MWGAFGGGRASPGVCGSLKILAYPFRKRACKVLYLSAVAKAADRLFPGASIFYVELCPMRQLNKKVSKSVVLRVSGEWYVAKDIAFCSRTEGGVKCVLGSTGEAATA